MTDQQFTNKKKRIKGWKRLLSVSVRSVLRNDEPVTGCTFKNGIRGENATDVNVQQFSLLSPGEHLVHGTRKNGQSRGTHSHAQTPGERDRKLAARVSTQSSFQVLSPLYLSLSSPGVLSLIQSVPRFFVKGTANTADEKGRRTPL